MTRTGRGLMVGAMVAGMLLTTAVPAMAGDVAPPNGSVVGDWRTSTDGVRQTLTFDSDGSVYGDSGCNRFTGGYTIKGDRIKIGPLASTLKACPEPIMGAEMAFLTTLQSAKTFAATDTRLKLYGPSDVLKLRAV